jgi:putative ATP-binding cassette transporter
MQTANAFGHVNDALSWFIQSYTTFADWRATVDRLIEFSGELDRQDRLAAAGARQERAPEHAIELDEVAAALPNGAALLESVRLRLRRGESVLLRGRSGSGKSTLFRLLAGLWPFGSGRIRLPEGASTLFLPQRPYMPIGTLREALWFPEPPDPAQDDEARAALDTVELPGLAERLDEYAHWSQVLSPGELQRLALARALLVKPDWLFLDEASSAMDEEQEAALYRRLVEALPRTTIVSIGHRRSLEPLHDRIITLDRPPGQPGRLVEGAVAV